MILFYIDNTMAIMIIYNFIIYSIFINLILSIIISRSSRYNNNSNNILHLYSLLMILIANNIILVISSKNDPVLCYILVNFRPRMLHILLMMLILIVLKLSTLIILIQTVYFNFLNI